MRWAIFEQNPLKRQRKTASTKVSERAICIYIILVLIKFISVWCYKSTEIVCIELAVEMAEKVKKNKL